MSEASRDQNHVPSALGVSSADSSITLPFKIDSSTGRLLTDSASGSGDVVGPASATDNAVVLFDGTTGKLIKNSTIKLVTSVFSPVTTDTVALGSSSLMWSDLFLASGAVINIDNGNWVATHTSGILTVGTGDLRVTTAGTNTASVVTVGGTQTLTSKTLTSPTVTTSPTAVGATWADLGIVTTVDINGGTIDGVVIGGSSAGAITGTTITANTGFLPDIDGGAYLGQPTQAFANLYLDTAATINFDNGNAVITHSSGILTISTGDLRVTTAGTNSASVVTVGGTQTLTAKTLTSPTITTATLSGAQQLAEGAGLRLDAALSADGTYSGTTIAGTAGATLAFGDLVYLAAADSRWELADADSNTTSGGVLMGFCVLAAASDGDPTVILLDGNIRADTAFPALTIGAPVYAGTTAGDIQVAQPSGTDDVIQVVGFALTADSIIVRISPDYITHT